MIETNTAEWSLAKITVKLVTRTCTFFGLVWLQILYLQTTRKEGIAIKLLDR